MNLISSNIETELKKRLKIKFYEFQMGGKGGRSYFFGGLPPCLPPLGAATVEACFRLITYEVDCCERSKQKKCEKNILKLINPL